MVEMMQNIDRTFFGGRRVATRYSCHRGDERPRLAPNLSEMYSTTAPQERYQITEQAPGMPSAEWIIDKYIAAIGGLQKVAGLTSLSAKGNYNGSPASLMTGTSAVEIFAEAPAQRTMIVHTKAGDFTTSCDRMAAWSAAPVLYSHVPVLALTGPALDAAKVEAALTFPSRIKQM